jgi:hypothetical protein
MKATTNDPSQLPVVVVHATGTPHSDLLACLGAARIRVVETELIDQCVGDVPAGPAAVILFPDDFRFDQVVGILFALRRERADVALTLVTNKPELFAGLIVAGDWRVLPAIIELSAPSSTILETIRTQLRQFSV